MSEEKQEVKKKKLEELEDHEINLYEYVYDVEDTVEIPAKMLEGLIQVLDQVKKQETNSGFVSVFPKTAGKVVKNGDRVAQVDVDWEVYPTAESYFNQQPQEIMTMLGALSWDLLLQLQGLHVSNIRMGKAKKIGSMQPVKQESDVKLS